LTPTPENSNICSFENDKLILRLDVTLPAIVDEIAPVVNRILDLAKESGCLAGKEFEVTLSLQEALTNAVIHGAQQDPTKLVQVTASCDHARGILIVVQDPGPGFDVNSIPSPIMGERIFSSHGRGIFLINQLMDEVRFHRGGAEIHMLKK
jgi:serine/threonine-protein kinase RsbW